MPSLVSSASFTLIPMPDETKPLQPRDNSPYSSTQLCKPHKNSSLNNVLVLIFPEIARHSNERPRRRDAALAQEVMGVTMHTGDQ